MPKNTALRSGDVNSPTPDSKPLAATFVLPSRNRSGGVRVTVQMANLLLEAGHRVRLAYGIVPLASVRGVRRRLSNLRLRLLGLRHFDWVQDFKGEALPFSNLRDDVEFEPGEIVVAVGSQTTPHVYGLGSDVIKMRYCHGFAPQTEQVRRETWGAFMPTIVIWRILLGSIQLLWIVANVPLGKSSVMVVTSSNPLGVWLFP